MVRNYTNFEQGKRLAGLGINQKTADAEWVVINEEISPSYYLFPKDQGNEKNTINRTLLDFAKKHWPETVVPSWSLTTLLDMLPPRLYYHGEEYFMEFFKTPKGEWVIQYPKQGTLFPIVCHQESFDSPIDAIYQMVCYLQEELDDEFTTNKPGSKEAGV